MGASDAAIAGFWDNRYIKIPLKPNMGASDAAISGFWDNRNAVISGFWDNRNDLRLLMS